MTKNSCIRRIYCLSSYEKYSGIKLNKACKFMANGTYG